MLTQSKSKAQVGVIPFAIGHHIFQLQVGATLPATSPSSVFGPQTIRSKFPFFLHHLEKKPIKIPQSKEETTFFQINPSQDGKNFSWREDQGGAPQCSIKNPSYKREESMSWGENQGGTQKFPKVPKPWKEEA